MIQAENENQILQQKIDEYGDMLFKLSLLRLQNVQDAEDVVQEVFYQYLRHKGAFESKEHEKAWLIKVALNACRKLWRSAWSRHHSMEPLEQELFGEAVPGTEDAVVKGEAQKTVFDAVTALSPKYRDVIHLFYYEEMSIKEIAEATGRRESTVTSQLCRARDLLKKALREEYDFA